MSDDMHDGRDDEFLSSGPFIVPPPAMIRAQDAAACIAVWCPSCHPNPGEDAYCLQTAEGNRLYCPECDTLYELPRVQIFEVTD